jgi:hypothetical protein
MAEDKKTILLNGVEFPATIPVRAVLKFLYNLQLCDHVGDVGNDVYTFVEEHLPNLQVDESDSESPYFADLKLILEYDDEE